MGYPPRVTTDWYPILIVGAGPVGLTLALHLLREGFAVIVLERRPTLALDPRATTIQPPVLESLADLGILEAVDAKGRRVHGLEYWSWGKRRERLAHFSLDSLRDTTAYPFRLHCAQPDLVQVLYDAVEEAMPGTVHLGERVTGFIDQGNYVEVKVEAQGRTRSLRASWLCGADGTKSFVRSQLDLPMHRLPGSDTFFTAEVDDLVPEVRGEGIGHAAFLLTPLGPALFMRMRDTARILLRMDGTRVDDKTPDLVAGIVFGQDSGLKLHNRAMYTVRQQVAERWVDNRVVILGDAAHATLPVNGTAMNTGILDGASLAEALPDEAAVLAWQDVRRSEVTERVDVHANAEHQMLVADGLFATRSRREHLAGLQADPRAAREHLLRVSLLDDRD